MIETSITTSAVPPDDRLDGDAPIRDTLRQLGFLSDEQTARVVAHQAERGLGFDQAALELGFIGAEELDRARDQLINSMALQEPAHAVSDELVILSDPVSSKAESIRLLRTQIVAQHIKPGRRALALVAAVEGSGCTYLAANLAAALSQIGIKTLLVDGNMRSPRLDQIFGLDPNAIGLSSFLSLQVPRPERVVHANVLPNLSVIASGPPVARPQELLSSGRFRDGMNMLLREYDIALFDTPPANSCADALSVAGTVGYGMIVARRDQALFSDVSALAGQLAAARCTVIGSVLSEF